MGEKDPNVLVHREKKHLLACGVCGGLLAREAQDRAGYVLICSSCLQNRRVLPDRNV